jgi:YegS/Rv2252/BmrU family lipid kinase
MKKLLLLVNPFAGRQTGRNAVFDLVDRCDAAGYQVEVHPTRGREDTVRLLSARAGEFDLVLCCGGDGTLNETVSGLMGSAVRPPLGYIPAGTTNDFASTLGIPREPAAACERALYGKAFAFDVGRFNEKFFTYIAAFGAFTEVSYQTPQTMKNTLGHAAYLLEGIRRLPEIRPQRVHITYDGGELEDDYIFGAVSNSTSVAGVLRLSEEKVSLSDGKFEVMLIKNPHDIVALNGIIANLLTQNYDDRYVSFFHTTRAVIDTPDGMTWTLDGESGGNQTHVEIENCHCAVQLMLKRDE